MSPSDKFERDELEYLESYYKMSWWKGKKIEPVTHIVTVGNVIQLPRPKNYNYRVYVRYPQIRKGIEFELILMRPPFNFEVENVKVTTLGTNRYKFVLATNPYPSIVTIYYKGKIYWVIGAQVQASGRVKLSYIILDDAIL